MNDLEAIKVDLTRIRELEWVPDNLSKLKKLLHGISPSLYGLPLIKLYYSTAKNQAGSYNRLDGSNNLLHAFRIIVGTTWNWLVCNVCDYRISEETLYSSIDRLCRECGCHKGDTWSEKFEIEEDEDFKFIMDTFNSIIALHDKHASRIEIELYFKCNLAQYSIQNNALYTLLPLDVQYEYKKEYGNKALSEFKKKHQDKFSFEVNITKDVAAWAMNFTDTEIRTMSWLSAKTVQRKFKGRNSKAKHGRKHVDSNNNPAMSTSRS